MLAYVFWHWPISSINTNDYTNHLIAFHRSLQSHAFSGFHSSHIFQLENAPWGPPAQPFYEDWYLVENFIDLETLNQRAVTAENKNPHDQAAQYAADGKAGIYQLCAGKTDPISVQRAYWFSKPMGMTYETLFSLVNPLVAEHGGALWQRQMTLGPTPEFCWWADSSLSLPERINAITLPLHLLWS